METKVKIIDRVEQVLEKGSGDLNEDHLLVQDNIFGVFDGASSLDRKKFNQFQTGGYLAAHTAKKTFSKNHFPLRTLGVKANQAIRSEMIQMGHLPIKPHHIWSTSAAVIRVRDQQIEWLKTGDAQVIVIFNDDSFAVMAPKDDHDYETLCMLKQNHFEINREFKEQIKKVRAGMNKTYGVLNGDPRAADFLNHGLIPAKNIQTILLFTDGLNLPSPRPALQKSFKPLVGLFLKLGLEGLKDHIRAREALDPDIQKYPRFKCHDDIAAVAVHLS